MTSEVCCPAVNSFLLCSEALLHVFDLFAKLLDAVFCFCRSLLVALCLRSISETIQ